MTTFWVGFMVAAPIFACVGFVLCAILVSGAVETPRPPHREPRTPETIGDEWLEGDWLEQWERRNRS